MKGLKKLLGTIKAKIHEADRKKVLRILKSGDVAALASALQGPTRLTLAYDGIGDNGAKALAGALLTNTTLTWISLDGNDIGVEGAKALAGALLTNNKLTAMYLGDNHIGVEGAKALAGALLTNTTLTATSLRGNGIGDNEAKALAGALRTNTTLTWIYLDGNTIGVEGAKALAGALLTNDTLTTIDLRSNNISGEIRNQINEATAANEKKIVLDYTPFIEAHDTVELATAMNKATALRLDNKNIGVEHMKILAIALSENKTITSLRLLNCDICNECTKELGNVLVKNDTIATINLADNRLGDDGAKEIATALRTNKALTALYLTGNDIGDNGAKEIATALRTNKTLTTLDITRNDIGDDGALALANVSEIRHTDIKIETVGNKGNVCCNSILVARSHPQMWAISYDQLLKVRDQAKQLFKDDFEDKTMRDINENIIIPVCRKNKRSYALSENICGLKTDVFVSHSWDEAFGEFVECIVQAYDNKLRKPNLWICAFGLLQGNFEEIKAQLGTGDTALDESPFVRALKGADNYLVVRNSNTDLCGRIWCICEFIYAQKYGLIPGRTLVTGPDTFADKNTSCIDAQSYDPSDKEKILEELTTNSSVADIDAYIREFRSFGWTRDLDSTRTTGEFGVNAEVNADSASESQTMSPIERLNQIIAELSSDITDNSLTDSQQQQSQKRLKEIKAVKNEVLNNIKEKDLALEESGKVLKEKDEALKEKDQALKEKDQVLILLKEKVLAGEEKEQTLIMKLNGLQTELNNVNIK